MLFDNFQTLDLVAAEHDAAVMIETDGHMRVIKRTDGPLTTLKPVRR